MDTVNVPDESTYVKLSEIRWTAFSDDPWPPLETLDVDVFDEAELREYARNLQEETRWLRRLVHAALAQLQVLTARLETALRAIRALRRQERRA